jgi:hypothetical protein
MENINFFIQYRSSKCYHLPVNNIKITFANNTTDLFGKVFVLWEAHQLIAEHKAFPNSNFCL